MDIIDVYVRRIAALFDEEIPEYRWSTSPTEVELAVCRASCAAAVSTARQKAPLKAIIAKNINTHQDVSDEGSKKVAFLPSARPNASTFISRGSGDSAVQILRACGEFPLASTADEADEALDAAAAREKEEKQPEGFSPFQSSVARGLLQAFEDALDEATQKAVLYEQILPRLRPKLDAGPVRWLLRSKIGRIAWGSATVCKGTGWHCGVPGISDRSVLYSSDDVAEYAAIEDMAAKQHGSARVAVGWSSAAKKAIRGSDTYNIGPDTSLADVGVKAGSSVSLLLEKGAKLNIACEAHWRQAMVASAETVEVILLLPPPPKGAPRAPRPLHVRLDESVECFAQRLAPLVCHCKPGVVAVDAVKLAVDRYVAYRETYEQRVARTVTAAAMSPAEQKAYERKITTEICQAAGRTAAERCIPGLGDRTLVDLLLADGKFHHPFVRRFWKLTANEYLPGMPELDRSALTYAQLLPGWRICWRPAGDLAFRHELTAAVTATIVDNQTWRTLEASTFERPEALRQLIELKRAVCRLPSTMRELAATVGVSVPRTGAVRSFRLPKKVRCVKQLDAALRKLNLTQAQLDLGLKVLHAVELRRTDRRRFQNHLIGHLLRPETGIYASLETLTAKKAKQLLSLPSPLQFCKQFMKAVKGVGPFAALKVAWLLQSHSRLPRDEAPPLGEAESAFCAARAAIMDELLGRHGPLWLKRRPLPKRRRGKTMDEQNYVRPTQAQVKQVLLAVQAHWVEYAEHWWAVTNAKGEFDAYEAQIKQWLLVKPTFLQVESLLCEVGNRQLRARDVAQRKAAGERGLRGAKGKWNRRAQYTRKDLSCAAFASAT